ncbi:DUF1932 domain-containing protein [Streptomyces sp. NPDC020875]|uniref:NAD(P)-dependent oxidoreductase n=1 Tax=Streptomyces sp. NPDC020875 TaxID=3154898 RepID=UPI0033F8646F
MTTLAVLHPGAMGAAVAGQAVAAGHRLVWVPAGRGAATRRRAEAAGLTECASLGEALSASDIVLSVCPPQAAEEVAAAVAAHGYGGVYVDGNAISPQRMRGISDRMPPACTVLDGMLSGPPPNGSGPVRFYLAGDPGARREVEGVFAGTRVLVRATEGDIGSASALKLAITGYQKISRLLAGVAYALATDHGVAELLRTEAEAMNKDILDDPAYLPSVAARAWRWGPEMAEIADTLRATGLPPDLAEAAAHVYTRWAPFKDQDMPLGPLLEHLHDKHHDNTGGHHSGPA